MCFFAKNNSIIAQDEYSFIIFNICTSCLSVRNVMFYYATAQITAQYLDESWAATWAVPNSHLIKKVIYFRSIKLICARKISDYLYCIVCDSTCRRDDTSSEHDTLFDCRRNPICF